MTKKRSRAVVLARLFREFSLDDDQLTKLGLFFSQPKLISLEEKCVRLKNYKVRSYLTKKADEEWVMLTLNN